METSQTKKVRKRTANFTSYEKSLLAQLIKKRPIVESKLTDGQSIAKKQAAWSLITQEFNANGNSDIHKRETITLKRAWDNMKAFTRKARATERIHLFRTGDGPHAPPSPQEGAFSTDEEAAPEVIQNSFDSDGTFLHGIDNGEQMDFIGNNDTDPLNSLTIELKLEDSDKNHEEVIPTIDQVPQQSKCNRPAGNINREAMIRIRNMESKKKIEMRILRTKLEAEEIRKRAALTEEEGNQIKKRAALLEEEENLIKKRAALLDEERNKYLLEKTKLELEEVKKFISKQDLVTE